jgi:protein-L-isoaspartate(D-aspartate) O-methyltransferase
MNSLFTNFRWFKVLIYLCCNNRSNIVLYRQIDGVVKSPIVMNAMMNVDRANYSPLSPYMDAPQGIGHYQTISAPHMHGCALEQLLPNLETENARILDVGCGSGYLAAVMARIRPDSHVYGIDNIPDLVALSIINTRKEVCTALPPTILCIT